MEMHQLRYFVAVAQAESFSRAAETCHVSQPSLSQQIQKLERNLGQPLFQRLGRRILLTEAGRLLLDRAQMILATAADAERQLRDSDHRSAGQLSIGCIPTVAPYLLPSALATFLRRNPGVEVNVQEDVTRQLLIATEWGELDLSILALPVASEQLQAEALFTEPLLLCMAHKHPLARRRRLRIEDLREERFIVLSEMHCLGEQVLSYCRGHGLQPRLACRSAQIETVQSLIALKQGVSLLPALARDADPGRRRVYRKLHGDAPTRTIAAVWHRHRYHSAAAEDFLSILRGKG